MIDLNFFFMVWFLFVLVFILACLLAKLKQWQLSKWIEEFLVYGKEKKLRDFQTKEFIKPDLINFLANSLQVPKRWFQHFYLYGFILQSFLLSLYLIADQNLFNQLNGLNRLIFGSKSVQFLDLISKDQTDLAFIFLYLQITRRSYECFNVSVFSDLKIHLTHYLLGFLFYTSINLLQFNLLFRSDIKTASIHHPSLLFGSFLYIGGFLIQHITLRQFASLRSVKKNGTVYQHYIPNGFMFKFVSCPHYLGEIMIYLGICVLLQWYINIFIIFVWTVLSHINLALYSHNWYLKHFNEDYPRKRKALFPFLL